jgi:hypothetical protein
MQGKNIVVQKASRKSVSSRLKNMRHISGINLIVRIFQLVVIAVCFALFLLALYMLKQIISDRQSGVEMSVPQLILSVIICLVSLSLIALSIFAYRAKH